MERVKIKGIKTKSAAGFPAARELSLIECPKKPHEGDEKSNRSSNNCHHYDCCAGQWRKFSQTEDGNAEKNQCEGFVIFHGLAPFMNYGIPADHALIFV